MNNEPVDYPPLQAGGIIENNEPYGWHCFIGKGKEEQDFLFINGKGASKPDASWDKVIPLYTHPVNVTYELTMEKCRQQQAEIEFLKKEILEKHEDWKHEGQQAANARAEIKALKEPREIIIKGDLYLANVLPNGGMEVRLKKAMI